MIGVGLFHYPPFTIDEGSANATKKYSGVEVQLVTTIAQRLNLTMDLLTPSDGGLWGSHEGGGSGLIGDIVEGRVDMGFAQLFNQPDR